MALVKKRRLAIRDLAVAIHRRMQELRARGENVKVTSAMSKILVHDPDYTPYRDRPATPRKPATSYPSIFTVMDIAEHLHTTVSSLIGERVREVNDTDVETLASFNRYVDERFVNPKESFVVGDFTAPERYETSMIREYQAAGSRVGPEESLPEEFRVVGAFGDDFRVVQVVGDSMADEYRRGDRVLIDLSHVTPKNDDVVVVYRPIGGGVIGYWRASGHLATLEKENGEIVVLESDQDWRIVGTITALVHRPAKRRRRGGYS